MHAAGIVVRSEYSVVCLLKYVALFRDVTPRLLVLLSSLPVDVYVDAKTRGSPQTVAPLPAAVTLIA